MTSGRTTWWAKDAAWHRRELMVELGEEFGAEGPFVVDVLWCWAQEQRDSGMVLGGFRGLSRETFVSPDRCRQIVAYAAEIGAIDDLILDDDGRRFTCRVSGFRADQDRGRAAWRQAGKRSRDAAEQSVTNRDKEVFVTEGNGSQRSVTRKPPPAQTRPDQTRDEQPLRAGARDGREDCPTDSEIADQVVGVLQRGIDGIPSEAGMKRPTREAVMAVLLKHDPPWDLAQAAAIDARSCAQAQGKAPNIVGLYDRKLATLMRGAA